MKKLLYLILLVMFFCTSMVYAETIEVKFDFENYTAEDDAKLIDVLPMSGKYLPLKLQPTM